MLAALEHLGDDRRNPVALDPERCVHAADTFATCQVCVELCPEDALHLTDAIALDEAACSACGACVHSCPVGAFEGPDETSNLLRCVTRTTEHRAVELVCARYPIAETSSREVDTAIVVETCLAALGPSTYAGLLALGVEQIDVRLEACATCPLGSARRAIDLTLRKARLATKPWAASWQIDGIDAPDEPATHKRPVYEAHHPPVSRRRLFNPLANADAEQRLGALTVDEITQAGRKRLPLERLRLLSALNLLPPAPQTLCPAPLAGQSFMRLGTDGCTACGACAKGCPTAALWLETDDDADTFQLDHLPAACTGCGICIDLCDRDAIYSRGVPFFSSLQAAETETIATGAFARCKRCGARLAPGEEEADGLCEICAFRRKNPFGSRIPQRMRPLINRAADNPVKEE